jgi:hypothetical protein
MKNRRWEELSSEQRAGVAALSLLQLALLAATLWDVAHRKPEEVRGDRRMWAGLAFVNWFGPLAYFAIGRRWDKCPLQGLRETCGARSQD